MTLSDLGRLKRIIHVDQSPITKKYFAGAQRSAYDSQPMCYVIGNFLIEWLADRSVVCSWRITGVLVANWLNAFSFLWQPTSVSGSRMSPRDGTPCPILWWSACTLWAKNVPLYSLRCITGVRGVSAQLKAVEPIKRDIVPMSPWQFRCWSNIITDPYIKTVCIHMHGVKWSIS